MCAVRLCELKVPQEEDSSESLWQALRLWAPLRWVCLPATPARTQFIGFSLTFSVSKMCSWRLLGSWSAASTLDGAGSSKTFAHFPVIRSVPLSGRVAVPDLFLLCQVLTCFSLCFHHLVFTLGFSLYRSHYMSQSHVPVSSARATMSSPHAAPRSHCSASSPLFCTLKDILS